MNFSKLIEQLSNLFRNLSNRQKIVLGVSVFTVIIFLVGIIIYTNATRSSSYATLFDNLSPSDMAEVIKNLEKKEIPYEIINESTIKVPKSVVYKERVEIASLGIPKNSKVGFSLFDKQEFGATDFDQKVKFLRAIEGELATTIESLVPIKKATVHIALPKESVFTEREAEVTASVAVILNPGVKLTYKQVQGIKNLVAGSITKLTPQNVTIVDEEGIELGEGEGVFTSEVIKSQQRYRYETEKRYEKKILEVLAPIVGGIDKVQAKVNIEFDFSKLDETSEFYDPNSVPRSEQTLEEKREGYAPKEVGGVPGAVSNIGPVQGIENNKPKEKYQKATTTTNYEISKKVTSRSKEFAVVKRVTVAVVLDGKYKEKLDKDGKPTGEMEYVPLDKTQLDAIESLVKRTVGYNEKRLDEVTVTSMQFSKRDKELKPIEKGMQIAASYLNPITPLLKVLFVMLVLFIFYKKVIVPFSLKMLESIEEEEELDRKKRLEAEDEEEDEDTIDKFKKARKKIEDQLGVHGNLDEDELKYEVLLEKIRHMVEDKSEETATLIKNLISNDQDFGDE